MMQQINLYQPLFRKQQKVFSVKTMLQALVVVVAGMVLLLLFNQWQLSGIQRQATVLKQQRDGLTRRIVELSQQFPLKKEEPQLRVAVEREKGRLASRERVLATLQQRALGNLHGFSEHLAGLARQRMPQLWLTRVAILQGGVETRLAGSTYDGEQLPQYLQRLAAESAFQGTEFRYFLMNRSPQQPRQLDFSISSHRLEEAQ